jgi:hypothetical protein
VAVQADAGDDTGVAEVQFLLDGVPLGVADTTAPYAVSWDTTTVGNGAHTITAVARDGAGKSATSEPVEVTVANTGPVLPAGLVGAWGFEEGSGSQAADLSGSGNTGALGGGAAWTADGRYGGAVDFDGVDGWVTVPDDDGLDLAGPMTMTAWVRPDVLGDWRQVLLKESGSGLGYAMYASGGSGSGPGGYYRIGGADRSVGAPGSIPVGEWTHLASSYDGAAMRLYVDGVLVQTVDQAGAVATTGGPLRIGGNAVWGEWFDGRIDEVRLYDRALSGAEIVTDSETATSGGA